MLGHYSCAMALQQAEKLSAFELGPAVARLQERLEYEPTTLRCTMCQVELDAAEDLEVVVFDQHFGHSHAQRDPVVVGLAHNECRVSGSYPFDQHLAVRWLNPVEPLVLIDRGPDLTPMLLIGQTYDVVVSAPDGAIYDVGRPWSAQPMKDEGVEPGAVGATVTTDRSAWAVLDGDDLSIITDGSAWQTISLRDEATHQAWRQAAAEGPGIVVGFTAVLPAALPEWEGAVLDEDGRFAAPEVIALAAANDAVDAALTPHGSMVFSVPVRVAGSTDRAIGRNERCACGSGRKFKQCCDRVA